jgi:hypothetical protein
MGDLERQARPVLTPMIFGHRCRLNEEQQELIALWASKTVLVIQSAEPSEYRWAPDELFAELFRARAPLAHSQIWIGHRRDNDVGWSRCHQLNRKDGSSGGFGSTLALGHLVIHFIWQGDTQHRVKLLGGLRGAFIQIWPVKRAQRSWPGLSSVAEGDLSWLAQEFATSSVLEKVD